MNIKYLRSKRTAERLIRKNGSQFDFRKLVREGYDPVTEISTETELIQKVWAVILPPSGDPFSTKTEQYKDSDGNLDLSKVKKVIISTEGLEFNPEPMNCHLFYRGEWWVYEQSTGLDPDGETDIMFKGVLRRQ